MASVSVVMPAYNVAAYLAEAAKSVQAQTIADWELLIVDDGSTDATHQIARGLADSDPRIKVLRKPNGGISPRLLARAFQLRRAYYGAAW